MFQIKNKIMKKCKRIKRILVDNVEYDVDKFIKEYGIPNEDYLIILIESGIPFDGRKVEMELI